MLFINHLIMPFSLLPIFLLLLTMPLALAAHVQRFDAVVAKDKSGDFTRISDAIIAAPNQLSRRYYIRIKSGIYQEHVEVPASKTYISLIGDGVATTKITNNRNEPQYSIDDSGMLIVYGNGFMAWNMTIENTAGFVHGRAVALRNAASHTVFYNCAILGYQDALYAHTGIQFYKDCDICGSVDFIFGAAKAVFQDCGVFARRFGWATAQAKATATQMSGFVFQNCNVTVAPDADKDRSQVKLYLGRPWRDYAAVMFMESFLDDIILPAGWDKWDEWTNRTRLVSLAEYKNHGPGANISKRVRWPGVHLYSKPYQARPYTVANYINGNAWLNETGVPFRSGLNL